jgi:hypothetical protein
MKAAGILSVAVFAAAACSKSNDAAPSPAPAKTEPPKTAQPAPPPKPTGPMKCSDFFTADEAKAAGFDTMGYDPDGVGASASNVGCSVAHTTTYIFRGDNTSSLIEGFKRLPEYKPDDGPKIGASTQWLVASQGSTKVYFAIFASSKNNFSANVSGLDKAAVEKFATALSVKFDKM